MPLSVINGAMFDKKNDYLNLKNDSNSAFIAFLLR